VILDWKEYYSNYFSAELTDLQFYIVQCEADSWYISVCMGEKHLSGATAATLEDAKALAIPTARKGLQYLSEQLEKDIKKES
jgi:hypothetical protein